MMQSLLILGRQPTLGLAELESLLGADYISPFGDNYALSDTNPADIPFARIGGSIKLCSIVDILETSDWRTIEKAILKHTPDLTNSMIEGKITCGISVYDLAVNEKEIMASGLRFKKVLKSASNLSVRLVPVQNQSLTLSSAQVLHNKLTRNNGIEVVIVHANGKTIVARTTAEQDINAYAKRDQNRPKRDARVGMLPPKLAQILVNLAVDTLAEQQSATILDPFCGTGVVLQEAALMGYNVYGTDIEDRMIEYSAENLAWLNDTHTLSVLDVTLQTGDATSHTWDEPFTAIACEGYLGQPFSAFPSETKLREVTHTTNQIAKEFLKNIATQIPSGTRLCIGLPAWHKPNGSFVHLNLLDQLEELGYNRVSFAHTSAEELLYYRPDQVVARELLVITRK